jgi:hypothetical protein
MRADADAGEACDQYLSDSVTMGGLASAAKSRTSDVQDILHLAEIVDFSLVQGEIGSVAIPFQMGVEVVLTVCYRVLQDLDSLTVAFHVRDDRHQEIMGTNTRIEGADILKPRAGDVGLVKFSFRNYFRAGEYGIAIGLVTDWGGQRLRLDWNDKALVFRSQADRIWSLVRFPVKVRSEKC